MISTAFQASGRGKKARAVGTTPQSRTSEPLMMVTVASASAPISPEHPGGAVKASSDSGDGVIADTRQSTCPAGSPVSSCYQQIVGAGAS